MSETTPTEPGPEVQPRRDYQCGTLVQVDVVSFGYGHDEPPPLADITIDARRHFRNPHADPAMRYLNGLDEKVAEHVMATPGVHNVLRHTVEFVLDLLNDVADPAFTVVRVAVGCVGGRHRSVAMAQAIAVLLRSVGVGVDIVHRDIDRPVIQKA